SRSGSVGRLGGPDDRRDGTCVAQHHLFQRRRIQRRGRQTQRTEAGGPVVFVGPCAAVGSNATRSSGGGEGSRGVRRGCGRGDSRWTAGAGSGAQPVSAVESD